MENLIFTFSLLLALGILFAWAFRTLPREEWQFLATAHPRKDGPDSWTGVNYTFYGFFSATGYTVAVLLAFILLASVSVTPIAAMVFAATLLFVCMPSAKWVARIVEGKAHTLTIGGASFVGILSAPWIIWAVSVLLKKNGYHTDLPVWPIMAAMGTAYVLGESIGRLACISFGCCYGKSLSDCPAPVARLFSSFSMAFHGKTKKSSYESGLEGVKLFPVQAVSAVVLGLTAAVCIFLFLEEKFGLSLGLSIGISQIWRVSSEFLRADFRGGKKLTPYQIMAAVSVIYILILLFVAPWPDINAKPLITQAFAMVWDPGVIVFLVLLWIVSFVYTGKSSVTTARISFDVARDKI